VWLTAYFAVFTPSWLLFSSLAMSEGMFLALALAGFALWRKERTGLGAFVFGLLTLVRPVGVLIFAACWLVTLLGPRRRRCWLMAAVFLIAPVAWLIAADAIWGDPLRQLSAYVAKDFSTPLVPLLSQTLSPEIGFLKKALVWFTLLTNGAAIWLLFRRFVSDHSDENLAWLLWAALMAVFFLALPSNWAFGSLDRFFVASLPPMMVGLRRYFPRAVWPLAVLTIASVAVCLYWNVHMVQTVTGG